MKNPSGLAVVTESAVVRASTVVGRPDVRAAAEAGVRGSPDPDDGEVAVSADFARTTPAPNAGLDVANVVTPIAPAISSDMDLVARRERVVLSRRECVDSKRYPRFERVCSVPATGSGTLRR
jgi:hypothetical protein